MGRGICGHEEPRGLRLYEDQVCWSRPPHQAMVPSVSYHGCRPCGVRGSQTIDEQPRAHAVCKAEGETPGKLNSKPPSPAQMLYAKKIAQGKGVVIPEEAKANSVAMSAWIDSNRSPKRRKRNRKTTAKPAGSVAPQSTATTKRRRKRKADAAAAPSASA